MNRSPAVAACCLLLIATGAVAADAGAPLESSKQELRKLRDSSKTGQEPDIKEGVKTGVPALQIPGQTDVPAALLLNPEKLEKQRKAESEREERRNWLVNGVKRLEASEGRKDAERSQSESAPQAIAREGEKAGVDDSQSLLRLYEEQKKLESSRETEAKPARQPAADPLAPFLQGWLGNSPSRGPSFDEFVHKGGSGTSPVAAGSDQATSNITGGTFPAGPSSSTGSTPAIPAPNPYLAAPDSSKAGSAPLLPSLTQSPVFPSAANPVAPLVSLPHNPPSVQPESRPPERKSSLPPQAEEKKYFPQLNRF